MKWPHPIRDIQQKAEDRAVDELQVDDPDYMAARSRVQSLQEQRQQRDENRPNQQR